MFLISLILMVSQTVSHGLLRWQLVMQAPKSSLQMEALGQDDWGIDMPTAQWPTHGSSANQ